MGLFSNAKTDTESQSFKELWSVLSRHAGVGLWDAVLHNGDPMHRESQWRWSEEFRRLLGFQPGDVAGFPEEVHSWSDRLHPEDAQATFDAFGACLADRSGQTKYDVQYRLKRRDGAYRWFRAIGGVVRNTQGTAVRACGALIDIHEERDAVTRFELLDSFAGVGLWDAIIHNADPMHAQSRWRWSPELRRVMGFAPHDYKGFPDVVSSWADRLHPEDAQPTFDAFSACLNDRTGKLSYDVTYRLKIADGSYKWFRAVGGVLRDRSGTPLRACGSLIDVHEQKLAELSRVEEGRIHHRITQLVESMVTDSTAVATQSSGEIAAIAGATDELALSIREIASRVRRSSEATAQASANVGETSKVFSELQASIAQISEVVTLINGIASQTNLLALNATIEAARAGEAGKGFAVVATEVKQLATQSANATKQIQSHISTIQTAAEKASASMNEVTHVTQTTESIGSEIAGAVSQQDAASQEIARRVDEVSQKSLQLETLIQNFASEVRENINQLEKLRA
ncbi:PAS domain-containing methyl-accepting chemotaxis protein [Asticcacaulis sp.]|uniref:methyl-accepting chemotaxis protein n=1 Tax=Asticcacaulis sp. TaxID=1872648 RepID=UPI0031D858FC